LRFWSLPAGREQRGRFGLAFQEGFLEVVGTLLDFVDCAEHGEEARSWFPDEVQVLKTQLDMHIPGPPEQVFTGRYRQIAVTRQAALDEMYRKHPERFVAGPPRTSMPPAKVSINPITPEDIERGESSAVNFPTLPSARHTARSSTLI